MDENYFEEEVLCSYEPSPNTLCVRDWNNNDMRFVFFNHRDELQSVYELQTISMRLHLLLLY